MSTIEVLLGRLLDRRGAALILRGGPGTGKSALLAAAAGLAGQQGVAVVSTTGVPAEAGLAYAGLHRLLQPALPSAAELPAAQRAALQAAFGSSEHSGSPTLPTGLAALTMIGTWAAREGLLLIIDDAQWLDEASSAVLGFVARRLATGPALMLIALPDHQSAAFSDAGLPELQLGNLPEAAASALLDDRCPGLSAAVRERVIDEAAGNPLALIELPAVLAATSTITGSDDQAAALDQLPLTERLTQAFAAPATALPAATRAVLLAAAADGKAAPAEVLRAAALTAQTTVTTDALWPAVDAGLLVLSQTRLTYRQQITRSAIYHTASPAERQAAHAALATVLAGQPDRQVWHRAAATCGPDEQVAAALDQAATRAERRGAVNLAASALERAAEYSDGPARQGSRLLRAARMAFDSGQSKLGPRLLDAAEALDLPAEQRTLLSWLRQTQPGAGWTAASKIGSFIAMADRVRAEGHPVLAAESLYTAALSCWWVNPDRPVRLALAAAADRLGLPGSEPAMLAILGCTDPVQHGATVISRISALRPAASEPAGMFLIGSAATAVWAFDLAIDFLDPAVDGLRQQGRRGLLTQALVAQAWTAVHLSRPQLATAAALEARQLAHETGQLRCAIGAQFAQAAVAAESGDLETAERLTGDAESQLPTGRNPMLALAQFVRGHGAVANRHYAQGAEHLHRILDPADPAHHPFIGSWGLADLVEASAQAGADDAARGYLADLDSLAQATTGSLLLAGARYARPLVADDGAAQACFQATLEHDLANWPGLRGRMLLRYGGWLRRQRRVTESRTPLRAAADGFDALGFRHLADSARQELRTTGETSRRRTPDTWNQLTPRELQIAQLAADGLSNRQIGQQLYISHRTVGYHLHQIFPKLGLTSRSQLHTALKLSSA